VGTRYLYGDSDVFPDGFDVLKSLRQFVDAASKTLALMGEADSLEREVGTLTQRHVVEIQALDGYFDGIVQAIAERAARSTAAEVVAPVARDLVEHVQRMAAERRDQRAKNLDSTQQEIAGRVRAIRDSMREVVAQYLLGDPLPILAQELSLNLIGAPAGFVSLEHPYGIATRFELDLTAEPAWSRPRKLGEVASGIRLQIGTKTGLLRSAASPDIEKLDDFVIAGLEVGPASMALRIRKRADSAKDEMIVRCTGQPGLVTGEIQRTAKGEASFESPPDDSPTLERLLAAIRTAAEPLLEHKRVLLDARIGGEDLFSSHQTVRALLDAVAERLAPMSAAVWARSPNSRELSLKLEHEGGRREEIYLPIRELRALIDPLPVGAQAYFDRFDFLRASELDGTAPRTIQT
jgi:hypothetical protein